MIAVPDRSGVIISAKEVTHSIKFLCSLPMYDDIKMRISTDQAQRKEEIFLVLWNLTRSCRNLEFNVKELDSLPHKKQWSKFFLLIREIERETR